MDYFYVADGFGPNGLINYYLKSKYKAKDNLTLTLDAHYFLLPTGSYRQRWPGNGQGTWYRGRLCR